MLGDTITITPSGLRKILPLIPKNQVPMIWGPVGIGKTTIVEEYAATEVKGICLKVPNSSILPQDLRGLPIAIRGEGKVRATYAILHDILPDEELHGAVGVLFADEFNTGTKMVMTAWQQILLTGRLGNWRLPDGWQIICAGNRQQDLAAVNPIPDPVLDRMLHLEVAFSIDDFCEYALEYSFSKDVIAFARWRGQDICPTDRNEKSKSVAKATPRSWEMVSDILNMSGAKLIDEDLLPIVAGKVGVGSARDFMTFRRNASKLPSTKDLLEGALGKTWMPPTNTKGDPDPPLCYSIAVGLATAVQDKTWSRYVDVASRLPDDIQVVAHRMALSRPEIKTQALKSEDFLRWLKAHSRQINVRM